MIKAIFLDRDGVINKDSGGGGKYIESWKEFKFLPGSIKAIKKLNENGYEIFIMSNQAGVGRGIYSQASLCEITKNMLSEIEKQGGKIRSVSYCMHKPDAGCECRKPKTGMIRKATKGLDIDFKNTYFIGDSHRDVGAGNGMGCKTILLLTGKENPEDVKSWPLKPDFIKRDLREAVEWILKQERG